MNGKKASLALVGVLCLALLLTGCGAGGIAAGVPTAAAQTEQAASASDSQAAGPSVEAASPSETTATAAVAPQGTPAAGESETETTGEPYAAAELWTSSDGAWSVSLPAAWVDAVTVQERTGDRYSAVFTDTANEQAGFGGVLFTVMTYGEEETYDYLPDYLVLGEHNGLTYVALFPTDVQCAVDDAALAQLHSSLAEGLSDWLPGAVHFAA